MPLIKIKQYISYWAFLPMCQFSDGDSLKLLRPDFGFISKIAMLVDATFPQKIEFDEDDMNQLDSVNDFVKYLENKQCHNINEMAIQKNNS